jgi:DNA-binding MarR family transcriptional regulator
VQLSLTAAGRAVQQQVGRSHARTVARAMTAGLTHDELGQLEALCRKLAAANDAANDKDLN